MTNDLANDTEIQAWINYQLNAINNWNVIQKKELEGLKCFIDLEYSLYEELDSLVLVSKDSSAEHSLVEDEVPNFIQTLFSNASTPKFQPKATPTKKNEESIKPEEDLKVKQEKEEQEKLKNVIQSLKNEIKILKQSLEKKSQQEQEFQAFKKQELENIEKIKQNNLKELRREVKELENLKKCSILPSKKERIEFENLKKISLKEKEEYKQKEIRYLLAQDRFKRRIDELSKRNSELLEEVKVLERDRASYIIRKSLSNVAIQTEERQLLASKEAVIALSSLASVLELSQPIDTIVYPTRKVEYIYQEVKLVWYPNGTLKENYFSGKQVIYFVNGDKKTILEDGITLYWYAQPDILHTTLPNGLEVFEFSNGQIEKRHKDGTLEIHFPDSTIKYVYANGQVLCAYIKDFRKKYFFPMVLLGQIQFVKTLYNLRVKLVYKSEG